MSLQVLPHPQASLLLHLLVLVNLHVCTDLCVHTQQQHTAFKAKVCRQVWGLALKETNGQLPASPWVCSMLGNQLLCETCCMQAQWRVWSSHMVTP